MAAGAILAFLIDVQWYDTRRNFGALRAEFRAGIRDLRQDFLTDVRRLRADVRADSAHVRGNLAGLRRDLQALTVRIARIEGFLVGYFAARGPLDRYASAA